jgi:REP element-mobilizing transposase RayT
MRDYQSLAHTAWDCKYHIVFIPKGRKKAIFGAIRHHLGQVLHELAQQKECKIVEGHLMRDHVHICISIPPKHSVSYVVGYIKGIGVAALSASQRTCKRPAIVCTAEHDDWDSLRLTSLRFASPIG